MTSGAPYEDLREALGCPDLDAELLERALTHRESIPNRIPRLKRNVPGHQRDSVTSPRKPPQTPPRTRVSTPA
jgi:hypothetical protein